MRHALTLTLTAFVCAALPWSAAAQNAGPQRASPVQHQPDALAPVDQTVGDLDPLARSLRRVDPGNQRFSARTRLLRRQPGRPGAAPAGANAPRQYRFEAPGVQAWLRRPEYLVRSNDYGQDVARNRAPAQDGDFREIVPPDTVFDLRPDAPRPNAAPARPERPGRPGMSDNRINTRLDTRINGRVDTRTDQRLPVNHASQSTRRADPPSQTKQTQTNQNRNQTRRITPPTPPTKPTAPTPPTPPGGDDAR